MPSNCGECFVVLNPYSENNSIIFGRNSIDTGANGNGDEEAVQEVIYFPPSEQENTVQCDGGASITGNAQHAIIIVRNASTWGGESGANDQHVCIGIAWSNEEPTEGSMKSTDLLRLALERSSTADEAVNIIGSLNSEYGNDNSKYSFVIADSKEAWLLCIGGKLWAAEKLTNGYRVIPKTGLSISTKIDKSIDDLGNKLKDAGLWNGDDDLDFAKCFDSVPNDNDVKWPNKISEPTDDGTFNLINMFDILRSTENDKTLSSHVSVLVASDNGISCHWFTATPNPCESVFKPFIFTPNARISPLTKIMGENMTLLHKLHKQRNWDNVGNLLKSLESTCVDEVNKFLSEHPEPNQELDDLMKDCVEAEVKFYR